jgi:hypothetical protein
MGKIPPQFVKPKPGDPKPAPDAAPNAPPPKKPKKGMGDSMPSDPQCPMDAANQPAYTPNQNTVDNACKPK